MRRICAAAITLTVIMLAACGDDRTPTAPATIGVASANSIATEGCVEDGLKLFREATDPPAPDFLSVDEEVKRLIGGSPDFGPGLFTGANLQSSLSMWENLKDDKILSRPMQAHVDNETKFTLNQLGTGGVQDPDGIAGLLTATTGSVRLLDLIFRCTGTTPTSLPEPPAGFDAVWEMVLAVSGPQQVTTSFKDAAAWLPENALDPEFSSKAMLVVVRQPDDVKVNSPFKKVSKTFDVAIAGGKLKADKKATILVCPEELTPSEVYERGVIAHQKKAVGPAPKIGDGVEYLKKQIDGVLDCAHGVASAWRHEKGLLRQRTMQVASIAKKVLSFFGPKPLYAGHAAIGGISDGFSPMVAVDAYVETEIINVVIPETTYGQPINFTATLRVKSGPESWIGKPVTDTLPGMPTPLTREALQITATLSDGKVQSDAINGDGVAEFSFSRVNAGDHTADLRFPETLNLPANAPLFAADSLLDVPFHVNQAPLDVFPAAASKTYGDLNPMLTGDVQGEQYDEDGKFDASYATTATQGSFISTEERTYPITVASIAPAAESGVLLSNYVFDLAEHSALLTINQRTLTGQAAPANRAYGEPNPAFTGTITNPVSFNDGLVVSYANTSVATTPVGPGESQSQPYLIEAVLSGPPLENYINGITDGILTISPRELIGAPTPAAAGAIYGDAVPGSFPGTINANVGGGTTEALVAGDGVSASFVTTAQQGSFAGQYPIQLQLLGDAAPNYGIASVTQGVFTITPRPLMVTANDATRRYGDPNPTFTGVEENRYPGDDLVINYTTIADNGTGIGEYPIEPRTLSGQAASSYTLTGVAGTLTISPRPLTGTVDNKAKPQGAVNPHLTFTVNGLLNDGAIATVGTMALTESPIGAYPITVSVNSPNYVWQGTDGILTVFDPQPVLYGVESGTDGLSTINPATGARTFVGRLSSDVTRFTTPIAMATDRSTGAIYVWNNSDGNTDPLIHTGVLLTVNSCTGAGTQISTANSGVVAHSLAIAPDGAMYLVSDDLYRVNRTDGSLTRIGSTGIAIYAADVDPETGVLYGVNSGGTGLYTINLVTGAATLVAALSEGVGTIGALAFTPSGVLLGSTIEGNFIFNLDKTSGAVSDKRTVTPGSAPQGMGFAPVCSG